MHWLIVMVEHPISKFLKIQSFTVSRFLQIAKNVSVCGLVGITLFCNELLQVLHQLVAVKEVYRHFDSTICMLVIVNKYVGTIF
jgi:hypothetical protein